MLSLFITVTLATVILTSVPFANNSSIYLNNIASTLPGILYCCTNMIFSGLVPLPLNVILP